MGGDHGPQELIAGAILAVEQTDLTVCLVGDEKIITQHLDNSGAGRDALSRLRVVHAPTAVGMDENPVDAIRKKKDSSIMVAFDLVKNGEAAAAVSAGNSGATLAAGVRKLGRLKNVARPGLASIFPTLKGPVVIMDVGANVECRPVHLYQFAVMASSFSRLYDVKRLVSVCLRLAKSPARATAWLRKPTHFLKKAHSTLSVM